MKFPTVGLFNYWADMSNDDISIQNMKNDDDIDDDIDVREWKEPTKVVPSTSREIEGIVLYYYEYFIYIMNSENYYGEIFINIFSGSVVSCWTKKNEINSWRSLRCI